MIAASHALSERLTAMTHYFSAARNHFDKGDHQAAKLLFDHFLEQSDLARDLAQVIRIGMDEHGA